MTKGLLFPFSFCVEDIFRCPAQVSKDVFSARTDLVAQGAILPEEQLGTIALNLKLLKTGGLWWGHHCGQDITWAAAGECQTSRVAPAGPCGCVFYSTLGYWWLHVQIDCCTGSTTTNKGMKVSAKMLFDRLKASILQGVSKLCSLLLLSDGNGGVFFGCCRLRMGTISHWRDELCLQTFLFTVHQCQFPPGVGSAVIICSLWMDWSFASSPLCSWILHQPHLADRGAQLLPSLLSVEMLNRTP